MQPNSKPNRGAIVPAMAVVALLIIGGLYFYVRAEAANGQSFTLSGTIEATEIQVSARIGGEVQHVYVDEGDNVQAGQVLMDIYSPATGVNQKVTAPIDGVVLERLIEPSETAVPGSTLLVLADLNALTLKVYVPEDRYGQVALGQTYPVSVDSFPDRVFSGKVSHIADQAEF
ncbi:MAG TPA: efflux RND transporter periplasmic adaptor subunit, partial [Aggregatilineales bacterium]|nr:efflux RND transporter periplasmic adaptor subunit [Aggregatilineales bacterium]